MQAKWIQTRCHTQAGFCTGCLATMPDQVTREKSSQHMMFGNCFTFQCSWKNKQLIFSGLGVRRGVFGGFFKLSYPSFNGCTRDSLSEFPNTLTLRWSGCCCPNWRRQHGTCQQYLQVSSPGGTIGLCRAMARCPLA